MLQVCFQPSQTERAPSYIPSNFLWVCVNSSRASARTGWVCVRQWLRICLHWFCPPTHPPTEFKWWRACFCTLADSWCTHMNSSGRQGWRWGPWGGLERERDEEDEPSHWGDPAGQETCRQGDWWLLLLQAVCWVWIGQSGLSSCQGVSFGGEWVKEESSWCWRRQHMQTLSHRLTWLWASEQISPQSPKPPHPALWLNVFLLLRKKTSVLTWREFPAAVLVHLIDYIMLNILNQGFYHEKITYICLFVF